MAVRTQPVRPVRAVAAVLSVAVAVVVLLAALLTLIGGSRSAHAAPSAGPVKYYIVATQYQGQPEFLYEIAERFLGSGDRSLEIFNLNKGRLQPGGLRLENPEVIKAGWVLQLPGDAAGDGVKFGPLPQVPGPSAGAASGRASASARPSATKRARPASSNSANPSGTAASDSGVSAGDLVLWTVLGATALTLVAAVIWLLRTGRLAAVRNRLRRRRTAAPVHPDSSAAWTVDRSLRVLATACARQNRPLPGVYGVIVGAEHLRLRLSAPDELPPPGWSAEQDGRTWMAALRGLQFAPVDDGRPDPYPHLVTLGTTSDGRVLLNLAEAHGIIALKGDAGMQRRMADEWTRELASNPWSRGVTMLRAGFGAADPDANPSGTLSVPEATQLWDSLAEDAGGVILVARAPGGRDLERLNELAVRYDHPWVVVVLGGSKEARWQFVLQPDGWLETGFLPEPVRTRLEGGQPRPAAV